MPRPLTAPPSVIVLQLRHDQRDAAVRERHLDEVLVGAHPLHLGDVAVDLDDTRQPGDVEAGP